MRIATVGKIAAVLGLLSTLLVTPGQAATTDLRISTVSNRADLVSGGDVLVEITPAPAAGSTVELDGADVTDAFTTGLDGRHLGLVSGLQLGANDLVVNQPDGTGAALTITNHPIQGPIFSGPHLQPWDCSTAANGLGEPDEDCNADPIVDYQYISTAGGGYQAFDPADPPDDVAMVTTDRGDTVRHIVRRERGAMNRGLYAFAFLHDPALGEPDPRAPQDGWNRKLHYPFGASCSVNQTQGSMPSVLNAARLGEGFAIATSSLNVLGHHCNPVLSAESAMMLKERVIETAGPIRYTMSTGGSGGAIGQMQVSNAYPGITNGLMPSQMYPDVWSTAMEVHDCVVLETAGVPLLPTQKAAVDGHGPPQSSCAAWVALFSPGGIPVNGCFSNSALPTTATPDPRRDYLPVVNPDGCRATIQDLQVNVWGRREEDGFARRALDNVGVQYGLEALNLPAGDPGKITTQQFVDLNTRVGGVDIDGLPQLGRTAMDPEVAEIAYRSSMLNDGRGLARTAIINFAASANVEIHTPYHAYAFEERMAAIGHEDNHVIWHNGPAGTAWDTMDDWLAAVEEAGGIDPITGLDPDVVKATRPDIAHDSCWSGSTQQPLDACAGDVYGDSRIKAGMPLSHDVLKCTLKPIDPADYAGAVPPMTPADLLALEQAFPDGVCDYDEPGVGQDAGSVQWLTYANGPGGEPLGPPPVSTPR
jgi:hypothetical protein